MAGFETRIKRTVLTTATKFFGNITGGNCWVDINNSNPSDPVYIIDGTIKFIPEDGATAYDLNDGVYDTADKFERSLNYALKGVRTDDGLELDKVEFLDNDSFYFEDSDNRDEVVLNLTAVATLK